MGERCNRTAEVRGSNPLSSTNSTVRPVFIIKPVSMLTAKTGFAPRALNCAPKIFYRFCIHAAV